MMASSSLGQERTSMTADHSPLIISPSTPRDSRGETVYESQGEEQKDIPVVPGVLVLPKPLKMPYPEYPKSRKKAQAIGDVTVKGVIAEDGSFIDARSESGSDPEFAKSAIAATAKYRFKPATLDGRPVAMLTKLVVSFRIW